MAFMAALPALLQAAPAMGQLLGGWLGKDKNPLAGLEALNTSQFKLPGEDDLYKSINKAYDAIAPQFLNATAAQTSGINQRAGDAARGLAASMGRGVGSAAGARVAGEANASATQMRAQMEAQRAGAAQSQGQAGHQANVNQMLQKIQAHTADVNAFNQKFLQQSQAPSGAAAMFEGLGGLGSAMNAYQTRNAGSDQLDKILAAFGGGAGAAAGAGAGDPATTSTGGQAGSASGLFDMMGLMLGQGQSPGGGMFGAGSPFMEGIFPAPGGISPEFMKILQGFDFSSIGSKFQHVPPEYR